MGLRVSWFSYARGKAQPSLQGTLASLTSLVGPARDLAKQVRGARIGVRNAWSSRGGVCVHARLCCCFHGMGMADQVERKAGGSCGNLHEQGHTMTHCEYPLGRCPPTCRPPAPPRAPRSGTGPPPGASCCWQPEGMLRAQHGRGSYGINKCSHARRQRTAGQAKKPGARPGGRIQGVSGAAACMRNSCLRVFRPARAQQHAPWSTQMTATSRVWSPLRQTANAAAGGFGHGRSRMRVLGAFCHGMRAHSPTALNLASPPPPFPRAPPPTSCLLPAPK